MKTVTFAAGLLSLWIAAAPMTARAQGPLDVLKGEQRDTMPRMADDKIDGTIWEYKATASTKPAEGEEPKTLKGRFRTEGEAVFDVSRRFSVPGEKDVKKVIDKVASGESQEIKMPEGPQQKRI